MDKYLAACGDATPEPWAGVRSIIADLMHYAVVEGVDFKDALASAREHFGEESAGVD